MREGDKNIDLSNDKFTYIPASFPNYIWATLTVFHGWLDLSVRKMEAKKVTLEAETYEFKPNIPSVM